MSNSAKIYLRTVDGSSTNYLKKIYKTFYNSNIYTYADENYSTNLTSSLEKRSFDRTSETDRSIYGLMKQLCSIYRAYDPSYINTENYTTFTLVQLSNFVYGSTIMKSSFIMDDNTNTMHYVDDERGSIRIDASTGSIVGKIFYNEGIFMFTSSLATGIDTSTNYGIQLSGSYLQPKIMLNLSLKRQQMNCSNNSSYYVTSSHGDVRTRILGKQEVFFDKVYLYNSKKEIVGISKISQPIRKSLSDSLIVRINYSY